MGKEIPVIKILSEQGFGRNNAGRTIMNYADYKQEIKKQRSKPKHSEIPELYYPPKQTVWQMFINVFK